MEQGKPEPALKEAGVLASSNSNLVASSGSSLLPLSNDDDSNLILSAFEHSGTVEFKRKWIEFDCLKGVHHGKWSTYKDGKRIREEGGYIGRFNKVAEIGEYGKRRIREFVQNHDCHYAERFTKDLQECGLPGIEVEGWHSGRSVSRLSEGGRHSGSDREGLST